jgi:hypothetical protein
MMLGDSVTDSPTYTLKRLAVEASYPVDLDGEQMAQPIIPSSPRYAAPGGCSLSRRTDSG